jgi:hypothetical protein
MNILANRMFKSADLGRRELARVGVDHGFHREGRADGRRRLHCLAHLR